MSNAPFDATTAQADQARQAYNTAFEKLGLNWHWDAATYERLQTFGLYPVRRYLETEQAHLLSAYDADFLLNAIEAARSGAPSQQHHPVAFRNSTTHLQS
jgi:hypothetical protein